jgi:hypothetical protein
MSPEQASLDVVSARRKTLADWARRQYPGTPGVLLSGAALAAELKGGGALVAREEPQMLLQLIAPSVWSATWLFLLAADDADFAARAGAASTREALMNARDALRLLAHPDSPDPDAQTFRARMAKAMADASPEEGAFILLAGVPEVWGVFLQDFRRNMDASRAFAAEAIRFRGSEMVSAEGTSGDTSKNYLAR